jgi:tRNA (cytidine/uridine-2'-O-)-methyltransferase
MARAVVEVVLLHPQTARNAGSVARLCSVSGARLHFVRPVGFNLPPKRSGASYSGAGEEAATALGRPAWEREIRKGSLDYWDRVEWEVHDSFDEMCEALGIGGSSGPRAFLLTTKTEQTFWDVEYREGDVLLFGSESFGAPAHVHENPSVTPITIPRDANAGARSLNLSSSASVAVFEALRQIRAGPGK